MIEHAAVLGEFLTLMCVAVFVAAAVSYSVYFFLK